MHIMTHVHLHIQMCVCVCVYRQRKSCFVHPSPRWGCHGQWSVSPSSVRWVSLPSPRADGAVAAGSCKKRLPCFCSAGVPCYHNHCVGESLVYCSFPSVKPLLVLSNPDWGERRPRKKLQDAGLGLTGGWLTQLSFSRQKWDSLRSCLSWHFQ